MNINEKPNIADNKKKSTVSVFGGEQITMMETLKDAIYSTCKGEVLP